MEAKTQDATGEFTFPTPQIQRFYGKKPCICGKKLYRQGSEGNLMPKGWRFSSSARYGVVTLFLWRASRHDLRRKAMH